MRSQSCTCRDGWIGQVTQYGQAVFHAMHVILILKLGDHEGLTLLIHVHLLKRTLLVVLPAIVIQILIRAFLSPVPVCCRGHSGASWCCPAAAGGMRLRETQCGFCTFWFIAHIINITITSVITKAVSIFNL